MAAVDYSLYLVTDSSPAILGERDLCAVVEEAIRGGVTVVQLREKHRDKTDLIRLAKELHAVTRRYNIPLIVNDRVDVAAAAGVEGVHIGQDDTGIGTARELLGPAKIIGVSVGSVEEAERAAHDGADYIGIGTVYPTSTKKDANPIIGTSGVKEILEALSRSEHGNKVTTICIGGINSDTVTNVMSETRNSLKNLDGVAVVSAIVASPQPEQEASWLRTLVALKHVGPQPKKSFSSDEAAKNALYTKHVAEITEKVVKANPLCHNMTNLVVQNFAANVALAIGASPIMSNNGAEAEDLAALKGSLVINMGTVTEDSMSNYLEAIHAYNAVDGPVLFDPVGGGATQARREAVAKLVGSQYFSVIKGNEGEIKTVAGDLFKGQSQQQHGVDSGSSTLSLEQKVEIVKNVARRERSIVVMTGVVDVVSDGTRAVAVHNGHAYLGNITGSGCTLGTTIASYVAACKGHKLLATLAALLVFEIAAEIAAERRDVKGPGTFVPAFLDELYAIRNNPKGPWIERAHFEWH